MINDFGERRALLTDFYQLTMAYGYWKTGKCNDEAVFNLFFRRFPFNGAYVIACGLEQLIAHVVDFRFNHDSLEYLSVLQNSAHNNIFERDFIKYLRDLRITCDIDAIPEGSLAFTAEPMVRVKGPLLQCQLLESALLNIINYQSLIATKAARICVAARGPVFEFGLRRAPGPDGALSASRAAYIGGCCGTSNVLAGKVFGIPVKGTHAHSWVMAFGSESESFDTLAQMLPDDCILLVDTYDTLAGVERAARIGEVMKTRGVRLSGIRLDSGDIAELSCKAREILDRHGLIDCRVVASNELDEYQIASLRQRGAMVDYWGVGTRLVSGYDEGALSGVYKMSAIRTVGNDWNYKLKITGSPEKATCGGLPLVRRYLLNNLYWGDMVFDEQLGPGNVMVMSDGSRLAVPDNATGEELLQPIFRKGKLVYDSPRIENIRERTFTELCRLPEEMLKLEPTMVYPVGKDENCAELNKRLAIQYHG